jgi:DNA-3-methyladenine glycosylase II
VLALPPCRRLETEPEPIQIFDQGDLVFRLAAARVEVFNAEQEPAVEAIGDPSVAQSGIGMAKVKTPVRRRGKTENRTGIGQRSARKEKTRQPATRGPAKKADKSGNDKRARGAAASTKRLATLAPPARIPVVALIDGQAALEAATDALLRLGCEVADMLVKVSGRPPLRLRPPGFAGLAAIIVSQQVSTASAAAIFARLEAALSPLTAEAISAADDATLKAVGLSWPKIRALRALANAAMQGLDLTRLGELEAPEAHVRLTTIKGVGPWTADIFLLFCLGHPDAFPAGDLALQEAARMAFGLKRRPDAKGLEKVVEHWRPYRGVGARLLWAYYREAKRGAGMALTQASS